MTNSFLFLYYRLYRLILEAGNRRTPEFAAMFLMIMMLGLNFTTIISIFYLLDLKIDTGVNSALSIFICFVVLSAIVYFSFIHRRKYVEISKKFEHESTKDKRIGKLIVIGYVILSIVLIPLSFYLMILKNKGEL